MIESMLKPLGVCKDMSKEDQVMTVHQTRTFTAHNIKLDDGSLTKPDVDWLLADSPWFLSGKRVIETIYPEGLSAKRIADLGCLEGGYTVEFARLGMNAVGIEVRKSNFDNCQFVREQLSLPNLTFINDDVWNIGKYGPFDVIFCCGILYHLDNPARFVSMLSQHCNKALIINTHFASVNANDNFPLGELTDHEGLPGRWFHEYDPVVDTNLEDYKWAAWSNPRSFWVCREYILQMLKDSGFDLVFEQFDFLGDQIAKESIEGFYATHNRGMFVGIKTSAR